MEACIRVLRGRCHLLLGVVCSNRDVVHHYDVCLEHNVARQSVVRRAGHLVERHSLVPGVLAKLGLTLPALQQDRVAQMHSLCTGRSHGVETHVLATIHGVM